MNGPAPRHLAAFVAFLSILLVQVLGPMQGATPAHAEDGASAAAAAAEPGRAAAKSPATAAKATTDKAVQNGAGAAKPASGADATGAAEPRHGARSKAADGSLVVYDKVVGAYRSTDHPSTYWVDDRFWRYDSGVWSRSSALAGPWEVVSSQEVPKGPRGQHAAPKSTTTIVLPSGREAIYDPGLKAHKVVGRKGVFLFDGGYYRYDNGVWFSSQSEDGPWQATSGKPLPPALKRALPAPVHGDKVTMPSGAVLVYDADTKLYDVEGRPAAVYFDGAYYEHKDDGWLRSLDGAAETKPVEVVAVPVPVRAKYHVPVAKGSQKKAAGKKPQGRKPQGQAASKKSGDAKQAVRHGGAGAAENSSSVAPPSEPSAAPSGD